MQQISAAKRNVPKEIQMEFYNVSKNILQFLYQKLDYDENVLEFLLRHMKSHHVELLMEEFINNSQHEEQIVQVIYKGNYKLLIHYLKGKLDYTALYKLDEQGEKSQRLVEQIEQDSRIFTVSSYYIIAIADFLDPFSLLQFASTCREFHELIQKSEDSDCVYKKFCKSLLGLNQINLPYNSPFQKIVHHLNQNPHLLPPNVINEVNDDIRKMIWKDIPDYDAIITKENSLKHFGKQFKSFRQCYYGASRLNYCGVYAIKEKYLKFGQQQYLNKIKNLNREADMSQTYAPCHIVEYYRYIRFWRDGQVTMLINVKKLSRNEILHYFSNVGIQDRKILRGEFIVDLDRVVVKTFTQSTIFTYVYQIKTSQRSPCDLLVVKSNYMQTLGDSYITDLKKDSGTKFLLYKHMKEFREGLPDEQNYWKWVTY